MRAWRPPWPQTWGQVYGTLALMLLAFLALAFLLDRLKQVLVLVVMMLVVLVAMMLLLVVVVLVRCVATLVAGQF